jgi:aspartate/methionine/tyrosine aminotransferase
MKRFRSIITGHSDIYKKIVGGTNQRVKWRVERSFSSKSPQHQPLRPFEVEQYDGWHVPTVTAGLSDTDCEPLKMSELLALADDDCCRQWEDLSLGYPAHVQGDPELRHEIVKHFYPNQGSWDQINCLAPLEGIFCALQALLEPGDAVIVAAPCYQSLNEIPRSLGCSIRHWHADLIQGDDDSSGESYFHFDPQILRTLVASQKNKTKAVVLNFPHNPTGALPTLQEWDEIVDICRSHGIYLFCDEIYRGLEQPGIDRLAPAVEAYERGISLSGLSKAFGLAGLRMGWIAARDPAYLRRVQEIKDYTTMCSSTPTQILSLVALRNHDVLLQRCQRIVWKSREVVRQFCQRHGDQLEWVEPRAGSMVFPQLLQHDSAREYCDGLLQNPGIMLLPSSLFDYGDGHPKDDSRVRIGLGRETIPISLQLWEEHGV